MQAFLFSCKISCLSSRSDLVPAEKVPHEISFAGLAAFRQTQTLSDVWRDCREPGSVLGEKIEWAEVSYPAPK